MISISEVWWKQTTKFKYSHQHRNLISKCNLVVRSQGPQAQELTIYLFSMPSVAEIQHSITPQNMHYNAQIDQISKAELLVILEGKQVSKWAQQMHHSPQTYQL